MGSRRALMAILGAALIVRVAFIFAVSHDENVFYDAFYYRVSAVHLSNGEGFTSVEIFGPTAGGPDAQHPPLTALLLWPSAQVFGANDLPMRFTMTLVGLAAVLVIYLIGRDLVSERVGLIAAALAAIYPNIWMNDGLIMSESLSALAVAVALWLTYRLIRAPTAAIAVVAGAACGAGALARSELVLLVPCVVIAGLVAARVPWPALVRLAGASAVTTVLVLAPWIAYNFSRFEKPVFISTSDGEAVLGANCDDTYYGDALGGWSLACSVAGEAAGDQSTIAAHRRRLAWNYATDHLERLPVVAAARLGRQWSLFQPIDVARGAEAEGRPFALSAVGLAMYYVLVPLSVFGAVQLRRRDRSIAPLLGTFVLVTLTAIAVRGEIRFRVPAEVAIVVLSAVALDALVARTRQRRTT